MHPKISIGIPIYNEKETLKQNINSVIKAIKRTKLSYEILPCFNGTTDNGIKVVKDLKKIEPNIKILRSNPGRTKSMKKIISSAKGEIIIFCDADIVVDEDCYFYLLKRFKRKEIIAVVGNPVPLEKNKILYNILNVRMMNFGSEISKKPIQGFKHKPFIHGRIFAIRRSFFINNDLYEDRFENAINDDMFLTHLIMFQFDRKAIAHEKKAIVRYLPIQTLNLWWKKWVRLWGDFDYIYIQNPEFKDIKVLMRIKIDWRYVFGESFSTRFYFVIERLIHHFGKFYFNITKKILRRERCLRLDETKKEFKIEI